MIKKSLMYLLFVFYFSSSAAFAADLAPIVDTEWLEKHTGEPGLIIVDVRSSEDYKAGHVPGAISIPFSAYMIKKGSLSDEMPEDTAVAMLLGNAGIDTGSKIVAVGKAGNIGPEVGRVTRFLFTLAYAGVTNTAMLNGGMEKWLKEERPVDTHVVQSQPTSFQPEWNRSLIADKAAVSTARSNSTALCDFRPKGFYSGDKMKKPEVAKAGHLPGAVEIQVEDLFYHADAFAGLGGLWNIKPVPEFEKTILASVGSPKERKIICYCNTGVLSTLGWFVLNRMLGYENVSMYDGSLEEWTQDSAAPVEL